MATVWAGPQQVSDSGGGAWGSFSLSEMKLLDILSSLMMDDTYKGRGKYHSQVSVSRWTTQAAGVPVGGLQTQVSPSLLRPLPQPWSRRPGSERRCCRRSLRTLFTRAQLLLVPPGQVSSTGEFHR